MSLTKQAKTFTPTIERLVLKHLTETRYPIRNRVIFLLSVKAGLRAKEIAHLRWGMLTDAEGNLSEALNVCNSASKGRQGGRVIPMNKELRTAIMAWRSELGNLATPDRVVITSERGNSPMSATTITNWFFKLYRTMGLDGCSSHSGRRTFATRAARTIVGVGGSLKDVQELMGHASLAMTQRYIQGSEDAKRRVVDAI
ncbi:MAG: site-specific integrase [Magnetococcales bacterium]|nr:site-specific integrase [Magnetococcales bacterium]